MNTLFSQAADRSADPVVLKGIDLPCLLNTPFANKVAFKYDNMWIQVPIQFDEMALMNVNAPYGPFIGQGNIPDQSGHDVLFYTDPDTYLGADPDPNFDSDDELVFMYKDAGIQSSSAAAPSGTLPNSCCELTLTDPLSGEIKYLYIFEQDGSLSQDAGQDYVDYVFNLTAGDYPDDFAVLTGINPEQSTVTTASYMVGFSAEWIMDEWRITTAGSNGADILDRHQYFFGPGSCGRSEDTFTAAENVFVANIDGPVRAIRSIMGANSGPLTQRTNIFYEVRQDVFTDLRVHSVPSIYDVYDFDTNIMGMEYFSTNHPTGLTIDGVPDAANSSYVNGELVRGPSGALAIAHEFITTLEIGVDAAVNNYYEDNSTNPNSDCTGDQLAYGTCGSSFTFANNICTDPYRADCSTADYRELKAIRRVYNLRTNIGPANALNYSNFASNPIQLMNTNTLVLNTKILLQGPYDNSTGLMGDDLRGSSIPTAEPYAALGFPLVNSGSETFDNSLLSITGNDAIVDWVLVELRDKTDPTVLVATQSALLQRDGDIVSTDGISPTIFRCIPADAYFISIAHRNHLRVTSAAPIDLSSTPTTLDFSNGTTPTAGNNAQVELGNNVFALYAGDASPDKVIDAADRSETWNNRNQSGYLTADVNMDGVCDAADRSITWNNRNRGEQSP